MDETTWIRILGFMLICIVWLTVVRRQKIRRLHWMFFAVVLVILPWTHHLGFFVTLAIYLGAYLALQKLDEHLPSKEQESEGE